MSITVRRRPFSQPVSLVIIPVVDWTTVQYRRWMRPDSRSAITSRVVQNNNMTAGSIN